MRMIDVANEAAWCEQLRFPIDDLLIPAARVAPSPLPAAATAATIAPAAADDPAVPDRPPFARWLLARTKRGDWIDDLAGAARMDPAFPKDGDPDAVRRHLSRAGAEGDMFEATDDAEAEWLTDPLTNPMSPASMPRRPRAG